MTEILTVAVQVFLGLCVAIGAAVVALGIGYGCAMEGDE